MAQYTVRKNDVFVVTDGGVSSWWQGAAIPGTPVWTETAGIIGITPDSEGLSLTCTANNYGTTTISVAYTYTVGATTTNFSSMATFFVVNDTCQSDASTTLGDVDLSADVPH